MKKLQQINVRLDDDELAALRLIANYYGRSMSDTLRLLALRERDRIEADAEVPQRSQGKPRKIDP